MTKTFSAASIYGLIDRMEADDIEAWIGWHKRLKYPPRFINFFTAARFEQGPSLLHKLRDSLPDTTPVWRGYDGKDAWGNVPPAGREWTDSNYYVNLWNFSATSAPMAAGMWFARRVKPYVDVIRKTGAIVHLLNEATPLFDAPFETECIRLLGEEGIRAGTFAWTAGTPDWPDYKSAIIEAQIRMAAKYKALVMCHEYAGIKTEEQNSLINRNEHLRFRYQVLGLPAPDVFIGEFALAKAAVNPVNGAVELDPDVGWREMPGVTAQDYNQFIKATAKVWYLPHKISFSLYSGPDWGKNGSFGVMQSDELMDYIIQNSGWMCYSVEEPDVIPAQTPTEIVVRPPEASGAVRSKVKSIPTVTRNLRRIPSYLGEDVGDVQMGDIVRRFSIPVVHGPVNVAGASGRWVFVEKLNGDKVVQSGYLWDDRVIWDPNYIPTATQEIPEVPTEPAPPVTDPADPAAPQETMPPAPTPAPVPDPAQGHVEPTPISRMIKMGYGFEIDATPEMHMLIQKTIMDIINNVALLGQALAGVPVALVTTDVGH